MSTAAPNVCTGYVRGGLSTKALRMVLSGVQALENALTDGGSKTVQYVHHGQLAPGTLVGFVPYPELAREIIVARLPFSQELIPAVSLRVIGEDWKPNPQLISINQLLQYEGVILAADWLTYLVDLAALLHNPNTHQHGIDKTLLAIGGKWERWELQNLTWAQRCKDLAHLLDATELKPNTLLRKCARLGLFHRDNKGRSVSATGAD